MKFDYPNAERIISAFDTAIDPAISKEFMALFAAVAGNVYAIAKGGEANNLPKGYHAHVDARGSRTLGIDNLSKAAALLASKPDSMQ